MWLYNTHAQNNWNIYSKFVSYCISRSYTFVWRCGDVFENAHDNTYLAPTKCLSIHWMLIFLALDCCDQIWRMLTENLSFEAYGNRVHFTLPSKSCRKAHVQTFVLVFMVILCMIMRSALFSYRLTLYGRSTYIFKHTWCAFCSLCQLIFGINFSIVLQQCVMRHILIFHQHKVEAHI